MYFKYKITIVNLFNAPTELKAIKFNRNIPKKNLDFPLIKATK